MTNSFINYNGFGSSLLADFFNVEPNSIVDTTINSYKLSADIDEANDAYIITTAVPGLNKKDIKVEVLHDRIIVEGSKKINNRMNAEINREFAVYNDIDPDAASASVKDGILTVTVPKKAKKRKLLKIE
jgi:HSP20 family molecular chaperone IbpA